MESTHPHFESEDAAAEQLLAIGPTARLLGVSVGTVRRWEDAGLITSERTPGGQRRFRQSEIDRVRRAGTPA